jgi:prepilin-type N-terminal cleavage/methylation domain-containing protein
MDEKPWRRVMISGAQSPIDMQVHHRLNALTLIELLCVIAIIGVLAALLLGPAGRALKQARDADWADKAGRRLERVIAALQAYYGRAGETERLTVQQLFDRGIIDEDHRQFLTDRRVRYTPFVTADPDDLVVIRVDFPKSFLNDPRSEQVRKQRITEPKEGDSTAKS